jgi:hypothetical protein
MNNLSRGCRESSKRELRVWGFENAKKSKNLTLASFRSD